MDMEYLKYCIKSKGIKTEEVCVYMDISLSSLYKRLSGAIEWNLGEIKKLKEILQLSDEQIKIIFDI